MAVYAREDGILFVQFMYKGKTYIKSSQSKSRAKAASLEARMRTELKELHLMGNPGELSLHKAIDTYIESTKGFSRHNNQLSIRNWFKNIVPEKMMLHDITTKWLLDVLSKKKEEGIADGTLAHYASFMKGVSTHCQVLGHRVSLFSIPEYKVKNNRLRYLSIDEENTLLDALHPAKRFINNRNQSDKMLAGAQDDYDLVIILLDTGCRLNEIQTLEWKYIDLEAKTIQLYRPKVDNESVLYMSNRVHEVLYRRYQNRLNQYIFNARDGGHRKYNQGIRHVMDRLGMQDVSLHVMRHTAATKLIRAGLPLQDIQVLLGHTHANTTLKYSHISNEDVTRKARDLLNVLNGTPG